MKIPDLPPALRVPDLYDLAQYLDRYEDRYKEQACTACGHMTVPLLPSRGASSAEMGAFIHSLAEYYDQAR